jgi:hypothetical protein
MKKEVHNFKTPLRRIQSVQFYGLGITPKGIRTPVAAVRGRCPGPLDDGGLALREGRRGLPNGD